MYFGKLQESLLITVMMVVWWIMWRLSHPKTRPLLWKVHCISTFNIPSLLVKLEYSQAKIVPWALCFSFKPSIKDLFFESLARDVTRSDLTFKSSRNISFFLFNKVLYSFLSESYDFSNESYFSCVNGRAEGFKQFLLCVSGNDSKIYCGKTCRSKKEKFSKNDGRQDKSFSRLSRSQNLLQQFTSHGFMKNLLKNLNWVITYNSSDCILLKLLLIAWGKSICIMVGRVLLRKLDFIRSTSEIV